MLFTSKHALPPGRHMELWISWPARLDNKFDLELVVFGPVVRVGSGCAAVEIQRYEFRVESTASPPRDKR